MRLYGYTSTSLIRNAGMKFAFSNAEGGIKRVMFVINWNNRSSHYYMNKGAFEDEQEILLADGIMFNVIEVIDE